MTVRDFSLADMVERNAQLFPERESLVQGTRRMTFSEYRTTCRSLWGGLYNAGARSGDRIALIAHNSMDYMILLGAAAMGGLVVVPINWRLSREEIGFILEDAAPDFLVASSAFRDITAQAGSLPHSLKACYLLGRDVRGDDLSLAGLRCEVAESADVDGDAPYAVIYTAAVAGRSKGTVLSQANIMALGTSLGLFFELAPDETHACFLPLFHIAGLSLSIAVMQAGGRNVIQEKFDAEETLDVIETERATILYSFPPMLDHLIEKQREGQRDLKSLKYIGGLNPPDSIKRFLSVAPHVRFAVMFGQTEAMAVAAGWFDDAPGSSGRPAPLARLRIADEADREVPAGQIGEICVKSPCVFQGYLGLEEETAWTLRNGWHHTGDMGRMDERGNLWYTGRMPAKELIKTGGENVYPAEVEKAILEHPSVAEACVIGVPDERWGEAVVAICTPEPGHSPAETELISFVGSRLAGFKKPRRVVYVGSLPRTAEGAVDRIAVKKDHG